MDCLYCSYLATKAVSIQWTGLWTGLWDWTVGLDSQKAALIRFRSSTHYYTTVYLHHMNWIQGRRPSLNNNIDRTRRSFSSHFCWCACYTTMCTCKSNKHWPLSSGSAVNMHSCTLILSSKQSLHSGKSPHVCLR